MEEGGEEREKEDYSYKNQPFPWKLNKLCESPNAFLDFKRKNMRIIEDFDNLLEMKKVKFSSFSPSAALRGGRKGGLGKGKGPRSPPKLAEVLAEYK